MASNQVDITAGLATKRARTGDRNKFYLEIEAKPLVLNLDEQEIARPFALALAAEMKRALLAGVKMDGSPMPAPSAATVKRREYRDKQEIEIKLAKTRRMRAEARHAMRSAGRYGKTERSGATSWLKYSATEGQGDEATRQGSIWAARAAKTGGDTELAFRSGKKHAMDRARKMARNYKRRFWGLKLGAYDPKSHSNTHPIGVESGMLADSIRCEPKAPGFAVYVTDRRSFIDKTGDSPAKRVFGRTGFLAGLGRNPALQQAADKLVTAVIFKRVAGLFRELQETYQRAAAIEQQAEQIAAAERPED